MRAAYAAFDDFQKTSKEDLTLWLNKEGCYIYLPVFNELPAAHTRVCAAYDIIRNECLQQGKKALDLVTEGIIMLCSPIAELASPPELMLARARVVSINTDWCVAGG